MKRTLTYAIAAAMFAVGAATSTPKAHAAVDNFLWFPSAAPSSTNYSTTIQAVQVALAIIG